MTYGPVNSQGYYLSPEFFFPEDNKQFRELLSFRERRTADVVNIKQNGIFDTSEQPAGESWFSTITSVTNPNLTGQSKILRFTFRTVVNFGALPNAATKSVAHNIAITNSTIFTHIYATATNPGTKFVPIPYVNDGTPTDGIELFVDATNVNIKTTTANWIAFTTCYVVLEYIKS